VERGQAVWQRAESKTELVGELLVAAHTNGDFFVQFTKTPFVLATAQVAGNRWQIDFASGRHTGQGTGKPPSRFVWFQVPCLLGSSNSNGDWQCSRTDDSWRLESRRGGERLEGRFLP
jgi:hypothetical protein